MMQGMLSTMGPPQKHSFFDSAGRCSKSRQKSLEQIRKSFAPYKGGPSLAQRKSSAVGRRHGADGLTPEGRAGHLDLAVLSLPFPLIPIFDSFAVSVAVLPSVPFHVSFLHIPSFRSFSSFSIISTCFRFLLRFPSSDLAFACILASLQCPPQIRAIPLMSISWTSSHACFQFSAPCFASPACIASSASSGMMLAMLGV